VNIFTSQACEKCRPKICFTFFAFVSLLVCVCKLIACTMLTFTYIVSLFVSQKEPESQVLSICRGMCVFMVHCSLIPRL